MNADQWTGEIAIWTRSVLVSLLADLFGPGSPLGAGLVKGEGFKHLIFFVIKMGKPTIFDPKLLLGLKLFHLWFRDFDISLFDFLQLEAGILELSHHIWLFPFFFTCLIGQSLGLGFGFGLGCCSLAFGSSAGRSLTSHHSYHTKAHQHREQEHGGSSTRAQFHLVFYWYSIAAIL